MLVFERAADLLLGAGRVHMYMNIVSEFVSMEKKVIIDSFLQAPAT